jgi:hypothetical protein
LSSEELNNLLEEQVGFTGRGWSFRCWAVAGSTLLLAGGVRITRNACAVSISAKLGI